MPSPPHVMMLFLDGVGVGKRDPVHNPFFAANLKAIPELLGGSVFSSHRAHFSTRSASLVPLNATLGISGLPQSGTGQTALLTGVNAPRHIGKHFGPYPYSTLRTVIAERNIFRQLGNHRKKGYYLNAFPKRYFDYIRHDYKARLTAITLAWTIAGNTLNDSKRLADGFALSADMTNAGWKNLGYPDMPVISIEEAGERFVHLSGEFDFTLYEYYFTDHAGHHQSLDEAVGVLEGIDRFVGSVVAAMDHERFLLLITSDHGNVEDLRTKSHTRNPVPLLAIGKGHNAFTRDVRKLTDVTPAILSLMG